MHGVDIVAAPLRLDVPGVGLVVIPPGNKADVYQAFEACFRRRADATFSEMMEVLSAQLGRDLQDHVYSGRPSELVDMGVLERAGKREDAQVQRNRAMGKRASAVNAFRLPAGQRRLSL